MRPANRVTRDPSDPEFPHGTSAGYRRGCGKDYPCPAKVTCRQQHSDECRVRRANLKAGVKVRGRDATDVIAHVTTLLEEVPEATWTTIAAAVEITPSAFAKTRATNRITYPLAEKVLALTAGDLLDHLGFVDADEVRHMARRLQALGYPIRWIEDNTIFGIGSLRKVLTKGGADTLRVRADFFNDLCDLYGRIGNRPADPVRDNLDANSIAHAKYHAGLAGYERPGMIDAASTLKKCASLLANAPRATRGHIAKATGVDPDELEQASRTGRIHQDLARKIFALTPSQLEDAHPYVDSAEARQMLGTIRACGFPAAWITKETGIPLSTINKLLATGGAIHEEVERGTHGTIADLFRRLDGRLADPIRDNLAPKSITHAKSIAARSGFHPPAAYDDNGNVDPRAIPGHPWAEADDRCANLMEIAHSLATLGSRAAAVRATGDRPGDEQKVTRVIKNLGITFRYTVIDETTKKVSRFVYEPHEARDVNRKVFDHIEATWEQYESGAIGPVYAALVAGVADVDSRGVAALPKDHPEVIEYIADHPADEDQDDMATAA